MLIWFTALYLNLVAATTYLSSIIVALILFYFRKYNLIKILIIQSIITTILFADTILVIAGVTNVKASYPLLMFPLIIMLLLSAEHFLNNITTIYLLFVCILLFHIFLYPDLGRRVVGFRNILAPFLWLILWNYIPKVVSPLFSKLLITNFTIIIMLLVIEIIVPTQWYVNSSLLEFFKSRNVNIHPEYQLPMGWLSSLSPGEIARRYHAFTLNEEKLGYFCLLIVTMTVRGWLAFNSNIQTLLFLIGVFCITLFSGLKLAIVFSLILILYYYTADKYKNLVLNFCIISGVAMFFTLPIYLTEYMSSSGMTAHYLGLIKPLYNPAVLDNIIFGIGIGNGGTAAGVVAEDFNWREALGKTKYDVGGESGIGALYVQLGVIGMIIWAKCLIKLGVYYKIPTNFLKLYGLSLLLSESPLTLLGAMSFFIPERKNVEKISD